MLDGQRYGDRRKQHAYARYLKRQKFACPHCSLTYDIRLVIASKPTFAGADGVDVKRRCPDPVRSKTG
jgi:hypothetical protein